MVAVHSLVDVLDRRPLDGGAVGLSGARIERGTLADGTPVVLKHLPVGGDWLTRRTAGEGRIRQLFESGTFDRIDKTVEHAVIGVVRDDDGDVVVMRDVTAHLLPPATTVPLAQARGLLAGLAAFHGDLEGISVDGLCPPDARFALFAPSFHATDDGPAAHPSREFIVSGWTHFADLVPADIADAIFDVHERPRRLAEALASASPSTLVHGDAKLENLGHDGSRLVAIDWGDLTGIAPAAVDVAWFAIQDGWRFDVLPSEIFAAYDSVTDRPLDRTTVDLACIGALAWFGFKLAGRSVHGDEDVRARSTELLAWWVRRVADALPSWSG